MDHREFQALAVRTESIVDTPTLTINDMEIFLSVLDSFNHIVEVLDAYKKHIFYGTALDYTAIDGEFKSALFKILSAGSCVNKLEHSGVSFDDMSRVPVPTEDPRILHALLGSITEHGELGIAIVNSITNGGRYDLINVCEEIADSDWYKALFFESTGISWETVQHMVIKKLEIRYKDKIFNAHEAKDRNLEEERTLLKAMVNESIEEYRKCQVKK